MLLQSPTKSVKQLEKHFNKLYGEKTETQIKRYNELFYDFKKEFGFNEGYFASSSGRVEICGNHTDHNGGKVVSCAISLDTLAVFMPTNNNFVSIKSQGYEPFTLNLMGEEIENKGTSSALVRGVSVALKNNGYKVGGFCACINSNVLGGAGISSSASFELLIVEIFNFLFNESKILPEEKAKFAQFAESVYFKKPCGLLDQTAIAFGGLNVLDFKFKDKIVVNKINDNLENFALVLINTGGSHANLTSEYASIPREMFDVAKEFGKERLIDVRKEDFFNNLSLIKSKLNERSVLRATHFFEENDRVDTLCRAIRDKNHKLFLNTINSSGDSSRNKLKNCHVPNSEVQPIITALDLSKKYIINGASRVHGGGFAGTILCIISKDCKEDFILNMKKHYRDEDIISLKIRTLGTLVLI